MIIPALLVVALTIVSVLLWRERRKSARLDTQNFLLGAAREADQRGFAALQSEIHVLRQRSGFAPEMHPEVDDDSRGHGSRCDCADCQTAEGERLALEQAKRTGDWSNF